VFWYPHAITTYSQALPVLAMVVVPALLMVSTIRFQSFKNFDLQSRRSYPALILIAVGLALLASHTELVLVALSYSYLASAFVGMAWSRIRRRPQEVPSANDAKISKDTKAL
jgi:CDP-diacylglycerol--serine O-phosphatidyltransferase